MGSKKSKQNTPKILKLGPSPNGKIEDRIPDTICISFLTDISHMEMIKKVVENYLLED
jgi:hypothetical protein